MARGLCLCLSVARRAWAGTRTRQACRSRCRQRAVASFPRCVACLQVLESKAAPIVALHASSAHGERISGEHAGAGAGAWASPLLKIFPSATAIVPRSSSSHHSPRGASSSIGPRDGDAGTLASSIRTRVKRTVTLSLLQRRNTGTLGAHGAEGDAGSASKSRSVHGGNACMASASGMEGGGLAGGKLPTRALKPHLHLHGANADDLLYEIFPPKVHAWAMRAAWAMRHAAPHLCARAGALKACAALPCCVRSGALHIFARHTA